jgi:hypothetical protein
MVHEEILMNFNNSLLDFNIMFLAVLGGIKYSGLIDVPTIKFWIPTVIVLSIMGVVEIITHLLERK